jgi:hypothetical protein
MLIMPKLIFSSGIKNQSCDITPGGKKWANYELTKRKIYKRAIARRVSVGEMILPKTTERELGILGRFVLIIRPVLPL